MYRGFELSLTNGDWVDSNFRAGESLYKEYSSKTKQALDNFINPDGSVNASEMQKDWFPEINADVFISHSHRDREMAIALAGYLKNVFGIICFIDSCVWGYANDLLNLIDKRWCWDKERGSYIYENRNLSTSHVHMMLSTALAMMIDKCECLFFLNTPRSINASSVIQKEETSSPWLYYELSTTHLIRQKTSQSHREMVKKGMLNEAREQEMVFTYNVNLNHLTSFNDGDFAEWRKRYNLNRSRHALDSLYEFKPTESEDYFEK
jgi:hypothetical protein